MSWSSLGDLSQSFTSRQRNVALKQDIKRLTTELATGQVADVRDVLAGNYAYATDIEQRMSLLQGYNVSTSEASLFAGALQTSLERVEAFSATLASNLLTAGTSVIGSSAAGTAKEAGDALAGIMGAINTNSAGRYLMSGTATDTPPLAEPEILLAGLSAAMAGAATPQDALAAAKVWFDDPAGFAATVYQGNADGLSPFELSEDDRVALDIRAVDPRLREVLRLTAVAALATDPALGFDQQQQAELFMQSGQSLLIVQDDIVGLRAEVGFAEARMDKIAARNAAEVTSLEFAKNALLAIDPFEAATRLEEARFQLESLYSVTVRMSRLSLVNFL